MKYLKEVGNSGGSIATQRRLQASLTRSTAPAIRRDPQPDPQFPPCHFPL